MDDSPRSLAFQEYDALVYGEAARCEACSHLADVVPATVTAEPVFDISRSLDGAIVVSDRFRQLMAGFGGLEFMPVVGVARWWTLELNRVVTLDPFASHVRFGPECERCSRPRWVTHHGPLRMYEDVEVPPGLSRTDIAFGDTADFGPDQPVRLQPEVFADVTAATALKQSGFLGVHLITQAS